MKIVSEKISFFLNEDVKGFLPMTKKDVFISKRKQILDKFDEEEKKIILDDKHWGGITPTAGSILKFIQYRSRINGGVGFTDISKFIHYVKGATNEWTKENRGQYASNLYIKYGDRQNLLDGWCTRTKQGWYVDPNVEIKPPYYKLR